MLYEQQIESLKLKIQEQEKQIDQLSKRIHDSSRQVQDIAVKAVEGASRASNYYHEGSGQAGHATSGSSK